MSLCIYFIHCDEPHQPIKIGYAADPATRLYSMQVGCPLPLSLMAYAEVPDAKQVEARLHERFDESRIRGEWFAATPELLEVAKAAESYQDALVRSAISGVAPRVPACLSGDQLADYRAKRRERLLLKLRARLDARDAARKLESP